MNKCTCKFYELDAAAESEAAAMAAAYAEIFPDEPSYDIPQEPTELDKCGDFCKHLKSGKGYPGEYVYYCNAPGNKHIIRVDFNESEII